MRYILLPLVLLCLAEHTTGLVRRFTEAGSDDVSQRSGERGEPGSWRNKVCEHVKKKWPPESLDQPQDIPECESRGLADLSRYQHAIPLEDNRTFLPVYSSLPLHKVAPSVTRAIVWIHGARMNPNKYFCNALDIMGQVGTGASSISIAPWFAVEQVSGAQWTSSASKHIAGLSSVCWGHVNSWISGEQSSFARVTSFELIDHIILMLQANERTLPNLKDIILVGYSAGCQLLSRWSLFSSSLEPARGRAAVRTLLGGCGTFLYFDNTRPAPECSPKWHSGAEHICSRFLEPGDGACEGFDEFKYGLSMAGLVSNSYLHDFARKPWLLEKAIRNFPLKDVRFFSSAEDVCSCNVDGYDNDVKMCFPQREHACLPNTYGGELGVKANGSSGGWKAYMKPYPCCDTFPDGYENKVDAHCGALLQGNNRLQRARNYIGYLSDFFAKYNMTYRPIFESPPGGHDCSAAFRSVIIKQWVFGD